MSGLVAEAETQVARRIAMSAYNAFRYALHNKGPRDQELPAWGDLPEEAQDGWFRVVFVVRAETDGAINVPWSLFAQHAYEVYAKAVGSHAVTWGSLDPAQQIAWEAAARHVLGLFEAEDLSDDDEIENQEAQWTTWADRRKVTK